MSSALYEQDFVEWAKRNAELLRAGRLVAFPTETVYGLGANALEAEAVKRIFEAKGRPYSSPLIVHVASIGAARELGRALADRPSTDYRIDTDRPGSTWPASLPTP